MGAPSARSTRATPRRPPGGPRSSSDNSASGVSSRPMTKNEDIIAVLQRMVDGYADAIDTVLNALADETAPPEARRVLCGVLNYALDLLDIFPDHYKGLGVADDAMVLRIGAEQAVAAGA